MFHTVLYLTASAQPRHACRLLEGESGIKIISGFDIEQFPTKFAGEIVDFDSEGCVPFHSAHCVLSAIAVACWYTILQFIY